MLFPRALKGACVLQKLSWPKQDCPMTQSSCTHAHVQPSLHVPTPTHTLTSIKNFWRGLFVTVTCHTPLPIPTVSTPSMVRPVALPLRELQLPTGCTQYYVGPIHILSTSSKQCFSIQSQHARSPGRTSSSPPLQTDNRQKGRIFPSWLCLCQNRGKRKRKVWSALSYFRLSRLRIQTWMLCKTSFYLNKLYLLILSYWPL